MKVYNLFTWPDSQCFVGAENAILVLPPEDDTEGLLDSAYLVPTETVEKTAEYLAEHGIDVPMPNGRYLLMEDTDLGPENPEEGILFDYDGNAYKEFDSYAEHEDSLANFVSVVPKALRGIETELKKLNGKTLEEKYAEVKDAIDLDLMSVNNRHYEPGTLYEDVLIWLRDNEYGKDHDLAAMIIGNYAIDHMYGGEPQKTSPEPGKHAAGKKGEEREVNFLSIRKIAKRMKRLLAATKEPDTISSSRVIFVNDTDFCGLNDDDYPVYASVIQTKEGEKAILLHAPLNGDWTKALLIPAENFQEEEPEFYTNAEEGLDWFLKN